jgi:sigma-B regulation protein RsbU (phosphoserine phosphatase)
MCAEISVDRVRTEILATVLRQTLVSIIVLAGCVILLFLFFKKRVLVRIISLEQGINTYSETKDPSVADRILENKGTDDELGELAEKSADMIRELEDYMINLQAMTAERERIGAELNVATQIQTDMLPTIFPPFPDISDKLDISASMEAAKDIGGDFYDFFRIDDDHIALVIGDVCGKGIPAALFMAVSRTIIRSVGTQFEHVGECITNANRLLASSSVQYMFVTVFYAIYNIKTGLLTYCNGGHNPPCLLRANGTTEQLPMSDNLIVGAIKGIEFKEHTLQLEHGDTLVMFTDGVTEALNPAHKMFGDERLDQILREQADKSCQQIIDSVKAGISDFVGDEEQSDDITMLVLKRK